MSIEEVILIVGVINLILGSIAVYQRQIQVKYTKHKMKNGEE
jgi:hypothetical protein